ncbi:MAG TPA: DUF4173 domain-containing protein [Nocardioides sp.]|nr:DUF4173 domain-containing protein [Nocardioides sp.]
MSTPAPPAVPATPATPPLDLVLGDLWPDEATPGRPRVVAAAAGVGLLAGLVLPFRDAGVGTFLVLAAVAAPGLVVSRRPWSPYRIVGVVLALALLAQAALRDADWVVLLSVAAAGGVLVPAVVDVRTLAGAVASWAAVPLAALRGLPWLGRSLRARGGPRALWPVLRTVAVSLVLVGVFGALFASADAVFARWLDALTPDLTLDTLLLRVLVATCVAGVTLAGAYVALNPPRADRLAPGRGRAVDRAFEWLVPVGLVLGLYLGFVAAQATALFGGHDYVRETTGLTYAEHVHSGFGQMTVATVLTLAVVAVAARKAPRASRRDRTLLQGVLGALCVLNLVVVVSALYRMHVYTDAYGATGLRLLVAVFEGWVGLVIVLVLVAGARLDGWWLPRAALLSGAATVLGLALANPDGYVAARNVELFAETGRLDPAYLGSLSDDAVPALRELPAAVRICLLDAADRDDDWLEWNLGRSRAAEQTVGERARYGGCAQQ